MDASIVAHSYRRAKIATASPGISREKHTQQQQNDHMHRDNRHRNIVYEKKNVVRSACEALGGFAGRFPLL